MYCHNDMRRASIGDFVLPDQRLNIVTCRIMIPSWNFLNLSHPFASFEPQAARQLEQWPVPLLAPTPALQRWMLIFWRRTSSVIYDPHSFPYHRRYQGLMCRSVRRQAFAKPVWHIVVLARRVI